MLTCSNCSIFADFILHTFHPPPALPISAAFLHSPDPNRPRFHSSHFPSPSLSLRQHPCPAKPYLFRQPFSAHRIRTGPVRKNDSSGSLLFTKSSASTSWGVRNLKHLVMQSYMTFRFVFKFLLSLTIIFEQFSDVFVFYIPKFFKKTVAI